MNVKALKISLGPNPFLRTIGSIFMGFALLLALLPIRAESAAPPDGWSITITASRPGATDEGSITLGASSAAEAGFDPYDRAHPPDFPNGFVDLYTRHSKDEPGWEGQRLTSVRYLAEYGSTLIGEPRIISFSLISDATDMVSLMWKKITDSRLADYDVRIRDVSAGICLDMKRQTFYDLDMDAGIRPFQIEISPHELPTPTGTTPPTHTWIPTFTPTWTLTATPSESPTATWTPTMPPSEGWWELFEMACSWEEVDYTGRCDRNHDQQVDNADLLDLYECWHDIPSASKAVR